MSEIAGYRIKVETDPGLFRKNDIQYLVGSNRKLRALTGFVPHKSMPETLRNMYAQETC